MNILYVLSAELNYDMLVCNDAGPGYAEDMGWQHISISQLKITNDDQIIVVDNRIQESELPYLKNLIAEHPTTTFFLKIVDPCFENAAHPYYLFLKDTANHQNTFLLSVYQPKELTDELRVNYGERFIHLPYPYIKSRELDINIPKKNRIVISGSINEQIYPYRYKVWKKITRSAARLFFHILVHPGYPEMNTGHTFAHQNIRGNYVKYLAGYKYMLLCPSRCGLELLKYHEAAYAGCLPVGLPPNSYPETITSFYLHWRPEHHIRDTLSIIFNRGHNRSFVGTVRSFLHNTRNPAALNSLLKEFIENIVHTS